MAYWLLKSEPSSFSIDDFKRVRVTQWDGVRNYQARNYLQQMKLGDQFLFYHSTTEPIGVAGIGRVKKQAYPDGAQFIKGDDHFEPRATQQKPIWFAPDVEFVTSFSEVIGLAEIRKNAKLRNLVLLQKGSRLSVQPVGEEEFEVILKMAR